ncbi:MAG: MFS transporter, partial [Rhizobiales bacterium]|nr:MFS transporter [Hyphomicrobiales bacterium]
MAFNVRHPLWLPAAPQPGIPSFAILYMIETFTRASVATVIPVQAYDLLQDERQVSFLYTAVGIGALAFSLVIPVLIRSASRRWTYT